MTSSPSSQLGVGCRVRVKDLYLDETLTLPLVGTVEDVSPRPDWGGALAYCVMFDHVDPTLPPGGEFTADNLVLDELAAPMDRGRRL